MLKIKFIPTLSRIASKVDFKPIYKAVKEADIFDEADTKENALSQLTSEKKIELAAVAFSAFMPQIGAIGEEIPAFIALYKGISVEEAGELDAAEVFSEVFGDTAVVSFFKDALQTKAE